MKLLALGLLALDVALVPVFVWYKRRIINQAWGVGHALGRVSGMMSPAQVSQLLDDCGIDRALLPPR